MSFRTRTQFLEFSVRRDRLHIGIHIYWFHLSKGVIEGRKKEGVCIYQAVLIGHRHSFIEIMRERVLQIYVASYI